MTGGRWELRRGKGAIYSHIVIQGLQGRPSAFHLPPPSFFMPRYKNVPVDHVIDVRSKLEFWLGHLPGAVNVPVDALPDGLDAVPGVDRTQRILVYCASGMRSAQAAAVLRRAGYLRVTDAGGIGDARREFEAA